MRTSKGGNIFCYPENIAAQLNKLFGELAAAKQLRELDADGFAKAAAPS
jgi:cell filamentation protein